jgi:hypothetical protein
MIDRDEKIYNPILRFSFEERQEAEGIGQTVRGET